MAYQPIEDYGLIGDLRTVALVAKTGSIDWLCVPHFDSGSVFAALLDDARGGRFQITPDCDGVSYKQFYWPETNVLVTRFLSADGAAELIDFMPPDGHAVEGQGDDLCLVRRVTVQRGRLRLKMRCQPAFDYGRAAHSVRRSDCGVVFESERLGLDLAASVPLEIEGDAVTGSWTLEEGDEAIYVLRTTDRERGDGVCLTREQTEALFRATVNYWRGWLAQCTYRGRWREMVFRSALALKLLTFRPTGAIVAAPTMGLPEGVGGERNWDYRYAWIRDAAFTVYGLLRVGFTQEAERFMLFLEGLCEKMEEDGALKIAYTIHGEPLPEEQVLGHLKGYRGSTPVRVGNAAYDQLQLDIYGELFDAVYLHNKYARPISYDFWLHLVRMADYVCANWQRPDEGIWEVRSGRQHFVYSKLMCWVALDRAVRLADKRSFPAPRERWLKTRDAIYRDIMERGWNHELQAFVQAYDSDALDAANLLMPLTFFMSPTDARMLATLRAIRRPVSEGGLVSNSLVFRYNTEHAGDGLDGEEGTFNICTFWLVEALTRAGRFDRELLAEARLIFERMMGFANHLGLYAEETGHSGEALGNYPQAFTHLALISAAFNLDRALGDGV